jgi:hypothetical protein
MASAVPISVDIDYFGVGPSIHVREVAEPHAVEFVHHQGLRLQAAFGFEQVDAPEFRVVLATTN